VRVELILANEGVLTPGVYPAALRLWGEGGTVWETRPDVVVAPEADGTLPLALPVLDTTIDAPATPGRYVLAAQLERGGWPTAGRLPLHVSEAPGPIAPSVRIAAWGLSAAARDWLAAHGVETVSITPDAQHRDVVVVGAADDGPAADTAWPLIHEWLRNGSTVVVLDPDALRRGEETLGWLPFDHAGRCTDFYDWVYHREWVRTHHPTFEGIGAPGLMDWDNVGPLLGPRMLEDLPPPAELAAMAFAVGYSTPGGYASGVMAGAWRVGEGRLFLNTLRILTELDRHPSADALLMNTVRWAVGVAS
jgi:hypothetical protein